MSTLDLNQEVTIHLVMSIDCYEGFDREDDYDWEVYETLEEAEEDKKGRLQYHPQGGMKRVRLYTLTFKVGDFLKAQGLDKGNFDSLDDISFESVDLSDEDELDKWATVKLNEVYSEGEDVEGKIIVSYHHYKYMDYAHKLERIRVADKGERLSTNPDHAFKTWDLVTDLTLEDFEDLTLDEAVDVLRDEIHYLKYGGIGFPSIKSIIESDTYGIMEVLREEEE